MSTTTNSKTKVTKSPAVTKPAATGGDEPIVIDHIASERLAIPILGTAPLIVNQFPAKAKRQMLDNMQGRKTPKEPKNPEAEYEAAFYRFPDEGYGFPALAFKDATVGAARFYDKNVTMTALRQFIFFHGERGSDGRAWVRIEGEPRMREDVVTVNRGGSDLRYRPEFWPWRTDLLITYATGSLTRGSLLSLVDAGGMGVGIGEWRVERHGDFGTYCIDPEREIEVLS